MPEYTDFVSMTKTEASAYLDQFLAEMQQSLDRFAEAIDQELTFTTDSLESVWNAVVPRLAWRAGYVPPVAGQPGLRIKADQLEAPPQLPSWFHHPSGAGYARFTAETLWLIDGAARYLGETFTQTTEGRWSSGSSRAKGYMFQHQPVICGVTPAPVSPIQTCAVLAARALRHAAEPGPRTLTDVYDTWCAQA